MWLIYREIVPNTQRDRAGDVLREAATSENKLPYRKGGRVGHLVAERRPRF